MKKILAKSKILIVDDFCDFRLSVKHMLQQLGAEDIDQASNAKEALKKCAEKSYHIILCDYNLGPGQDGQQILEELHERFLMLSGTLFLMVTAETSAAKVISAIEYQPDAYLTKPFTRDQLAQRLRRLIIKNAALTQIYKAINAKQSETAIQLCEQTIEEFPKVKFACMRLKSEILEKQQKFDEALEVFESVMQLQPLLWAMIGVGRIYYNQKNHQQALDYFLEMKESFPSQVSVLDWIAKCQTALGDNENAETIIKEALKLSPKSVRRQSSLGEVAESLSHHDIALKAYGKAINEGSHSCLLQPEHFQRFYENTRELAVTLQGREQFRILESAENITKQMERKYDKEPGALASCLSTIAKLFSSVNQTEKSARFLSKLSRTLNKPGCKLSEEQAHLIEQNLQAVPEDKSTAQYLDKLSSHLNIKKDEVNSKLEIDEESEEHLLATKINREGMILANQNRPLEALSKFNESISLFPNNISYLLNASQVILESDSLKTESDLIQEAIKYLKESISIDKDDSRWKRYQMLLEKLPNE